MGEWGGSFEPLEPPPLRTGLQCGTIHDQVKTFPNEEVAGIKHFWVHIWSKVLTICGHTNTYMNINWMVINHNYLIQQDYDMCIFTYTLQNDLDLHMTFIKSLRSWHGMKILIYCANFMQIPCNFSPLPLVVYTHWLTVHRVVRNRNWIFGFGDFGASRCPQTPRACVGYI